MTLILITEQIKRNITCRADSVSILRGNQLLQLNVVVSQSQHCSHVVHTYAGNRAVGNFQRSCSLRIVKAAMYLYQHIRFAFNFRRVLHDCSYNRRVSLYCGNLYIQLLLLNINRTADSDNSSIAYAVLLLQSDIVKMQYAALINASFKTHVGIIKIMNFYIIGCSCNLYAFTTAVIAEQQLSLHQAVDIVIQARHAQQAADITPNIFHLALNIMLHKVEIEVCTV